MTLVVADNESDDETSAIAQRVAASDTRASVFTVPPRPTDKPWRGKNWACLQAAERVDSEYLLFIDADVRLEADAITCALTNANRYDADLLSCAPKMMFVVPLGGACAQFVRHRCAGACSEYRVCTVSFGCGAADIHAVGCGQNDRASALDVFMSGLVRGCNY